MTENTRSASTNPAIKDGAVPASDNKTKVVDNRHTKPSPTNAQATTTTNTQAQNRKAAASSHADVLRMWGPAVPLPTEMEYYMPRQHFDPRAASNVDAHKDYTYGFLASANSHLVYEMRFEDDANGAGRKLK